MFGGYRSEGNIAGEVNSNPHASAGVMLIASKPLQGKNDSTSPSSNFCTIDLTLSIISGGKMVYIQVVS